MSRVLCTAIALGGLATILGCAPSIRDDIDIDLDFSITASDSLHAPYVKGAVVTLGIDVEDDTSERWTSDDEGIFKFEAIDGSSPGRGVATGAGLTTVHAWFRDEEVASTEIDVREPDGVALLAHGPLI